MSNNVCNFEVIYNESNQKNVLMMQINSFHCVVELISSGEVIHL